MDVPFRSVQFSEGDEIKAETGLVSGEYVTDRIGRLIDYEPTSSRPVRCRFGLVRSGGPR